MRLRVTISTRAREIPWDQVQAPGRGVFYEALERQDPQLGATIHANGWGPHGIAPFGHSAPTFPTPKRQEGKYVAGGTGTVEFGSPIPEIITALAKDFTTIPVLDWGGTALKVEKTTVVDPPAFASGRGRFRTINPITVKAEATRTPEGRVIRGKHLLPGEPGFDVALQHSIRRKCETFGHGSDVQLEGITWIGPKRSFAVTGHGHWGKKLGAPIEVEVSGPPAALQALWSTGIGGSTASGFGWVVA
ncbi:CRISPR-associated endoribonuclease Cas6 [Streptomyces sp. NPDC001339]|uniref:CRISPR-associated endoribonuclease Cas6 n=1 Tax=unclassified Streptomyces TaxID=2593676 RepID=UPI0008351024|nr:CRISPR-associated endoribonuclease Cas6 [Streptomyces sp. NBRC 110611]GAU69845.1 hypothetical protein SSP35_14_01790 [Streptomyces sp. NBRC 110611]